MLKNGLLKVRFYLNRLIGIEQIKELSIRTYSNSLLNNFKLNSYLPRTGMSINSFALAFILNEIIINERKTVIEFGSGISTIFMAKLAVLNNIDLEIISIDEDYQWIEIINKIIKQENLERYVKLIFAPIKKISEGNKYEIWYDEKELDTNCLNKKFDMILVDGPKVLSKKHNSIRGRALFYLENKLADNFVVFLDDSNRPGEKNILKNWRKKFNITFNIRSNLAIGYKGKHFLADPIWNYNS